MSSLGTLGSLMTGQKQPYQNIPAPSINMSGLPTGTYMQPQQQQQNAQPQQGLPSLPALPNGQTVGIAPATPVGPSSGGGKGGGIVGQLINSLGSMGG